MNSLKHSVCHWCHSARPLAEFAAEVRALGYDSIELLEPEAWSVVRAEGLACALASAPGTIPMGFNRREHHAQLVPAYLRRIGECTDAGVPNIVCFSGNRDGQDDEEGLAICTEGIRQITDEAERAGVTVVMELLNSKVDHPDYQCDRTAWGVELVRRVASERFKLLYDIYHMQIMEGDVIRTINEHHASIAHYHTAGNPGRHEIDASQELNYPAIMRAIKATGYRGYIGQEFTPTGDPLQALREARALCHV